VAIDQRKLKINRDFLLGKHKDAEKIFMQDRFNEDDIKKLIYHYEVAAEYAQEFFPRHIVKDEVYLKAKMKKVMNDKVAGFKLSGNAKFILDNTLKRIEKLEKKKQEEED
jgi:hypothetical protein